MYCFKVTWRSLIWLPWWRSMGSGQTPVSLFTSTIFALGKTRPVQISAIIFYIFLLINRCKTVECCMFHSGSGIDRETRQCEETFYKENNVCNQRRIWQHENKICINCCKILLPGQMFVFDFGFETGPWKIIPDPEQTRPNSSGS